MADSFWSGGSKAYAKGLPEELQSKLKNLEDQLDSCKDEATRRELEGRICELKGEYQRKLDQSGRNIH